jgi:hypothetical protein
MTLNALILWRWITFTRASRLEHGEIEAEISLEDMLKVRPLVTHYSDEKKSESER